MLHLLDNIVWNTLTGPHARFATGPGDARRYARGFSPIVGFADPARPDFAALAEHFDSGEDFYCDGCTGSVPAKWRIDAESTMFKMHWDSDVPTVDGAPDAVRLGPEHAGLARALDHDDQARPVRAADHRARRLFRHLRRRATRCDGGRANVRRNARRLYERLGFRDYREVAVRVVSKAA